MRYYFYTGKSNMQENFLGLVERSITKSPTGSIWEPEVRVYENSWISLMLDEDRIIGYYEGAIYIDPLGRWYSAGSYISISPEYQGRGLCREFARFTYGKVFSVMHVDYITITVASELKSGACRCYTRAAKDLGLNTFIVDPDITEPSYYEVDDCSKDPDFLVFTTLPVADSMMLKFITA